MAAGRLRMRAGKRALWSPQVLSRSVLKEWWNADDHGTTRMTDDGAGVISAWADRISLVSATGTTTARPTWASNSLNSAYAGVTGDGVANALAATTLTALPTGANAGEIWIVADQQGSTAAIGYAVKYGNSVATSRQVGYATSFAQLVSDGSTNLVQTGGVDGLIIHGGYWSGTTEGGRLNGADMSPATATIVTLATGTTRLRLFAGNSTSAANFWKGTLRHVMIINGLLSAADRLRLEGWFAWDSGLTSLLPSTHPYKNMRP